MNEETSELEEMLESLTFEYTGQNGRSVMNMLLPTLHLYVVNMCMINLLSLRYCGYCSHF